MTQNEITTNCICDILRDAATLIRELDVVVRFPDNSDGPAPGTELPFLDEVQNKIKHGGKINPTFLYNYIHYIADMMEQ